MDAVFRYFLHCPETVAWREISDGIDIGPGSMAGRLWLVADMAFAQDLSQGHPHVRCYSFGRYRGLYQMAFRRHLLGCNIRRWLRAADVPARQICLYLDSDVNPVLHLSLPLLSELSAVLRAGGKCNGNL